MKPRFSIVIPTYNRANLVPLAIRSVLNQSFHDFEIIISNGGSTDSTREAVKQFNDQRIRYIESDKRLRVGENYQNGLDHASGEFITFLSDDDAYTPRLLETVNKIFESRNAAIVGYNFAKYYHDDILESGQIIQRNAMAVKSFDGKVTEFTPESAREQVMVRAGLMRTRVNPRFISPYLSNATYHRSVFEQLMRSRRNLFDTVPPDEYLNAAVFFTGRMYYCLDLPLLVWSNWSGNTTVSAKRNAEDIRTRYEQLLGGAELKFTPLKFAFPFNCGVNAILEAFDDAKYRMEIDWGEYFVAVYRDLLSLAKDGVNVEREILEFRAVLASNAYDRVRSEVQRRTIQLSNNPKSVLFRLLPNLAVRLRSFWQQVKRKQTKIFSGDRLGFEDVAEAATSLQPLIDRILDRS